MLDLLQKKEAEKVKQNKSLSNNNNNKKIIQIIKSLF